MVNHEERVTKIKTLLVRSNSCNYSDAYILVERTITVGNTVAAAVAGNNVDKKMIFKNCARFTNCISRINNS